VGTERCDLTARKVLVAVDCSGFWWAEPRGHAVDSEEILQRADHFANKVSSPGHSLLRSFLTVTSLTVRSAGACRERNQAGCAKDGNGFTVIPNPGCSIWATDRADGSGTDRTRTLVRSEASSWTSPAGTGVFLSQPQCISTEGLGRHPCYHLENLQGCARDVDPKMANKERILTRFETL
jgi:hypothetical protein